MKLKYRVYVCGPVDQFGLECDGGDDIRKFVEYEMANYVTDFAKSLFVDRGFDLNDSKGPIRLFGLPCEIDPPILGAIAKLNHRGTTFIFSPVELPWIEVISYYGETRIVEFDQYGYRNHNADIQHDNEAKPSLGYLDPRWQRKRLEILQRDDFTCVKCGDNSSTLHVHHLRYSGEVWEVDDSDLQTLCDSCHENTHGRKFN